MSVAHNRAAENNGPRWPDLHENAPRIPEFSSLFRPGHVNERVEVWRFEVQPWRRMEAGSRILIFIRASTPPRTTFHRPMWLVFLRLDGMEWSQNSARREVKRRRISGLGNYEPSPCVIGIQNLCQMYTYPILSMYFFFLFFQFFSSHFPEPSIKGYKSKTNTRVFIEKFAYFVLFLLSKLYKFSLFFEDLHLHFFHYLALLEIIVSCIPWFLTKNEILRWYFVERNYWLLFGSHLSDLSKTKYRTSWLVYVSGGAWCHERNGRSPKGKRRNGGEADPWCSAKNSRQSLVC